jgi:hypothetical protein
MDDIGVSEMQSTHAYHIDRGVHKANHKGPSEEGVIKWYFRGLQIAT